MATARNIFSNHFKTAGFCSAAANPSTCWPNPGYHQAISPTQFGTGLIRTDILDQTKVHAAVRQPSDSGSSEVDNDGDAKS